ncbi:reverse transcriptase domain-containing protein, partial [Tanacetum coccineum]
MQNQGKQSESLQPKRGYFYLAPSFPSRFIKVISIRPQVVHNSCLSAPSLIKLQLLRLKVYRSKMFPSYVKKRSTEDVQPPVVQVQSHNLISEPVVDPVSAPMPNQRTSIPFPSRRNDERRREKANDQIEKFYEIFRELADRSITEPIGIAKDVRLMVGKFQFPADFVVVDFEPDPRVPLILGRSFLKTSRALIDVYEGEITLRVGKEAITFNLDQTSRYMANYNHMTANRIDVIELASEEYSQEVLGFSDSVAYGNPSPDYDPIVSNSSPTLTPFGD